MKRAPLKATAGLALALVLAIVAAPAKGDQAADRTVVASAATPPVTLTFAPPAAASPAEIVAAATEAVAAEVAEAEFLAAVEYVTAVQRAEAEAAERARREAARREAARRAAPVANGPIDEIIARHFGSVADQARRIVQCESNGNPGASSPTNDHGLFQINIVHRDKFQQVTGHPWSDVYNAEVNTTFARWLYGQSGWQPWACRRVL